MSLYFIVFLIQVQVNWHLHIWLTDGESLSVLFQEMHFLHWKRHWMLLPICLETGIRTKLTHALGPMLTATLITMSSLCKMCSCHFYRFMTILCMCVAARKLLCSWLIQTKLFTCIFNCLFHYQCLILSSICRTLSYMGFSGILSPKVGALKTLRIL